MSESKSWFLAFCVVITLIACANGLWSDGRKYERGLIEQERHAWGIEKAKLIGELEIYRAFFPPCKDALANSGRSCILNEGTGTLPTANRPEPPYVYNLRDLPTYSTNCFIDKGFVTCPWSFTNMPPTGGGK